MSNDSTVDSTVTVACVTHSVSNSPGLCLQSLTTSAVLACWFLPGAGTSNPHQNYSTSTDVRQILELGAVVRVPGARTRTVCRTQAMVRD